MGLVCMRERAKPLGGTLRAGPEGDEWRRQRSHARTVAGVTIRVLLVDDQELVREGMRRILHPSEGFEIVGECDDGDGVEAAVTALRPDVVVLDIRMRRVDGIEAIRRLHANADAPPILVLTTFGEDEILSGALRAGASGFQLKDAPGEDLIRATRAVARVRAGSTRRSRHACCTRTASTAERVGTRPSSNNSRRESARCCSSSERARPTRRSRATSS